MTTASQTEPKPGDILGDYRIIRELGRGGMGVVFFAISTQADPAVPLALKWFQPHRAEPEVVQEIGSRLAQLHHPALVQVVEVDKHGAYLVMECITGEALGSFLKRRGRLTYRELAILTQHLCDGLSVLHEAGLLHRDVRPVNITATNRGWVLVDLSIPYMTSSIPNEMVDLSQRGPGSYIAPEVLQGKEHRVESDVYSASVTLYHALVGRRPSRDRFGHHLGRPKYETSFSSSLLDVFRKGASAHPGDRFSTVAELKFSILKQLESARGWGTDSSASVLQVCGDGLKHLFGSTGDRR